MNNDEKALELERHIRWLQMRRDYLIDRQKLEPPLVSHKTDVEIDQVKAEIVSVQRLLGELQEIN